MSEIKRCEICSTDDEKVMPEIVAPYYRCPNGCVEVAFTPDRLFLFTGWNDLMSKFSAKIESECAAREQVARKDERVKVVEEFCASLTDYAAKYYDSSTVADVRAVECTDIRAVAEEVKAR